MITKTTKYEKGYETPQGLEEDQYHELMYEFVDLAKAKGLTVRQAQKLFTDCTDMVLDSNISFDNLTNKLSPIDRLINKLDDIKIRLEDIPKYKNIYNDNPQC